MNLKTLEHFVEEHCVGREFDSCRPCEYSGQPSRVGGGLTCLHPEHPNNWESTLEIECMYCNVDMGAKNGKGVSGVLHSICPSCFEKELPKAAL